METTSGILDVFKNLVSLTQSQPTYHMDHVPLVYREPGVVTKYRPHGKGVFYYVKSVFQCNNETINVWTHLIGFFIILVKTLTYVPACLAGDTSYGPVLGFGLCALIYSGLSATAHTIHSKSPVTHYVCYQLDYAGVAQLTLGGSFLMIFLHITDDVVPVRYSHWLLAFNLFMGWIDFLCCTIAKLKYRRPYPFRRKLWQAYKSLGVYNQAYNGWVHHVMTYKPKDSGAILVTAKVIPLSLHALSNVVLMGPRFYRCLMSPTCHFFWGEPGLAYMLLCTASGLICAFTFSSHLPERIWPGKFDFIGQGHQIFHVFSVVMNLLQFESAEQDRLHYHRVKQIRLAFWEIPVAILLLMLACVLTIIGIYSWTLTRVKEDEAVAKKISQ